MDEEGFDECQAVTFEISEGREKKDHLSFTRAHLRTLVDGIARLLQGRAFANIKKQKKKKIVALLQKQMS